MNTNFDLKRIYYLMVRQGRLSYPPLLIGTGAIAGLLIIIFTLVQFGENYTFTDMEFFSSFLPFVFLGGTVFTSAIFYETNSPNRGYLYLTLPASTLEKLIASWLLTSIIFIVYAIVALFVSNIIISSLSVLFTSREFHIANFFAPWVMRNYMIYLIIQPIFFLGAIYFKRLNFLKTYFALFLVFVAILIYTAIAARLILFNNIRDMHFDDSVSPSIKMFVEHVIVPASKFFFWYCMAPFFLIVSYFRLKERQV
jgi:hypothetical protein